MPKLHNMALDGDNEEEHSAPVQPFDSSRTKPTRTRHR